MSNSSEPPVLLLSPVDCTSQILRSHVACIVGILGSHRLAYNQFPGVNPSFLNFHKGCPTEESGCFFNQLLIGVIFGIPLVVELDDVEVYQVSHCLVYSDVSSIFVVLLFEVGALRTVGDNMVRDGPPEGFSEGDQPLLPGSRLHGRVVLPVNISPIKIVLENEVSQSCSASFRILLHSCGHLGGSKGTHEDPDTSLIVDLLHSQLHFPVGSSERILVAQVHGYVLPNCSNIEGSLGTTPESEENVVVDMGGSVAGETKVLGNVHPIPAHQFVDVDSSNGVVVLRD